MLERKDVFPLFLELVPSVFKERIETHKTFIRINGVSRNFQRSAIKDTLGL